MEEEKKVNSTEAEDVDTEKTESAGMTEEQMIIRKTSEEFVRSVYNSVDYKSLFALMGQMDHYDEFAAYVKEYEANVETMQKEANENGEDFAPPQARVWHSFLDTSRTVSAGLIGEMWDQLLSIITQVSVSAAQTMNAVVYDAIVAKALSSIQDQHEIFAGAIGELHYRLETCEKQLGIEPRGAAHPAEEETSSDWHQCDSI